MSDEAAEFRNALSAAGQPWSGWGVRIAGAGILALLALQIIPRVPYGLYALITAVAVIAVGWVMLIIAMLKRRRWAQNQALIDAPLSEAVIDPEAAAKTP